MKTYMCLEILTQKNLIIIIVILPYFVKIIAELSIKKYLKLLKVIYKRSICEQKILIAISFVPCIINFYH